MKPPGYLIYQDETLLAIYSRRLEVRKIVAVIMAHVGVFALLLWPMLDAEPATFVATIGAGSFASSAWNAFRIWCLSRKIRALRAPKGGRP